MENEKIKVKIISKGNSISAKFSLLKQNSFKYHSSIRVSNNKDEETYKEGYFLSVKATDFEYILKSNDISLDEVLFDENSITNFYCFKGDKDYTSQNLTKSFVKNWFNYDCSSLYKYTLNLNKNYNWIGLKPFLFRDTLLECSFFEVYASENILDKEIEKIMEYSNSKGIVYEKLQNIINTKKLTKEEVENAYEIICKYDSKVQKTIDELKDKLEEKFGNRLGEQYGLDCGFLYMYTKNETYKNAKRILINAPSEINEYREVTNDSLNVNIPLGTQSTTVQREMFNFLKPFLEKKLNDEFYCLTKLD